MRYLSFSLENYKGLKKISIDDLSDLSCFIGNNESGKTTILKGIEIIGKLCLGENLSEREKKEIRPRESSFNGGITFSTRMKFTDTEIKSLNTETSDFLNHSDGELPVNFIYSFSDSTFVKETVNFGDNKLTKKSIIKLLEFINSTAPRIIYYDEFKFVVPEKIRFLKNETKLSEDLKVIENLKVSENLDAEKRQLRKEELERITNLTENQDLNDYDNRFWQNIFDNLTIGAIYKGDNSSNNTFQKAVVDVNDDDSLIAQRIEDINEELNKIINNDWRDITGGGAKFDRFYIERKPKNGEVNYDDYVLRARAGRRVLHIPEKSKGCQWYFCFKIYTEVKSRGDNEREIIFLLDEPASNLHIHPQDKILKSLQKLSKENNTSIIYSTHSPYLIDIDNKDNTYIVENEANDTEKNSEIKLCKYKDFTGDFRCVEPVLNKMLLDLCVEPNNSVDKNADKYQNKIKYKPSTKIIEKIKGDPDFEQHFPRKLSLINDIIEFCDVYGIEPLSSIITGG